ncbi:MAG: prolipoprotein diacylglyceryl transferase [Candidatus Omnitrophica bacterium]|nr:prolipoprotein diacylglyceryl transferase [Candidatus Omnitrophota bacterium]
MYSQLYGRIAYSLFSVLAYSAAGFVIYLEAKRKEYNSENVLYIVFAALLGGLIGSKLGSALFVYPDFYINNPLAILFPEVGGKTIVGGLIGGYIGVIIAKRILKVKRSTGDLFAPGLALGIAIGRIGCFLNGCCYGVPTCLPWGIFYKGAIRHPTQIYESIFCLILFLYLWSVREKERKEGDLFKIFLLAYCFFRFWVEFLRADTVNSIFNLSLAQLITGSIFIILAGYFLKTNRRLK